MDNYRLPHNIYGLAVCMLEILLWQPFVTFVNKKTVLDPEFQRRAINLDTSLGWLESHHGSAVTAASASSEDIASTPLLVKEVLLNYVRETPVAGWRDVVKSCD